MSLIKNCFVKNRLNASRNKSRHWFKSVEQAGRANSSEIKPDRPWAGKLTFFEDFILEHSPAGLNTASIEISGSF